MSTSTYYECLGENDQPATKRQRTKKGTAEYGYRSRVVAELNCPPGATVWERYTDGMQDWGGRIVSIRTVEGYLERIVGA